MKLKKNIYKPNSNFNHKFINCEPNNLNQYDYLRLYLGGIGHKRRGKSKLKTSTQVVLLQKKKLKIRTSSLSLLVSQLYKHEEVFIMYSVNSPIVWQISYKDDFLTDEEDEEEENE